MLSLAAQTYYKQAAPTALEEPGKEKGNNYKTNISAVNRMNIRLHLPDSSGLPHMPVHNRL